MDEKPSIGAKKPFPPPLPDPDIYTVEYDGNDDPLRPYNWSTAKKLFTALLVCSGTFIVSLNSAIFAPATQSASAAFDKGLVVGALGTTLFVLGFASGPLLWAPISELRGRRWPLTVSMLLGGIFTIGSAVAKDFQTLIITRFFAGVCGASQLSVVPGVLTDIFGGEYAYIAISLYAMTVFGGPFVAPFAGGFIVTSYLGWRWTLYIPAILGLVNGAVSLFFLEETYAPCILTAKASAIRKATGSWGIHAKHEELEVDTAALVEKYFTRPLRLLATEPILLAVTVYMSFVYGLVYALLEAYPVVFAEIHGMSPGEAGLMFIPLLVGVCLGLFYVVTQQISTRKRADAGNIKASKPEARLHPPRLGAPIFTIGLFWFGWTGHTASIHWAAPAASGFFTGFGVICVFLPCFNYIVEAYISIAASAVAANIILRSSVAAGFPLFTRQMFNGMGVEWACTLLGCLAFAMIPIPFILISYGPWLRSKSKSCQQAK